MNSLLKVNEIFGPTIQLGRAKVLTRDSTASSSGFSDAT